MKDHVNNGNNILGANSCLAVYEEGSQIVGTTVATVDPVQEIEFET